MSRGAYTSAPDDDSDAMFDELDLKDDSPVHRSTMFEDGDAGTIKPFRPVSLPSTNIPSGSSTPQPSSHSVNRNSHYGSRDVQNHVPISAPTTPSSALGSLRAWSLSTFHYTKQYVSERLGNAPKSTNPDLDARINAMKDMRQQYVGILKFSQALATHMHRVTVTQRLLGETFAEMSRPGDRLQDDFRCNAEMQRVLVKNGAGLVGALNSFTSCMNTLCHTTMEDTMETVRSYDSARLKYDTQRSYIEAMKTTPKDPYSATKMVQAERKLRSLKEKYEKYQHDVDVKLKFLEENKVSVCQKHLYHLQRAFSSYIAGNHGEVEDILRSFQSIPIQTATEPDTNDQS